MLHQAALALFLSAAPPVFTGVTDANYQEKVVAPHKGKVVVVAFWASYCVPCLKEIPALQKIAAEDKGIKLVFVSADPKPSLPHAKELLAKKKLSFDSFTVDADDPEAFITAVDPKWMGSIPFMVFYDKAGKKLFTVDGEQTPEEMRAAIARAKVGGT